MSAIISIGINRDKLVFNDKGWCNLSLFVGDDTNVYGQNVTASLEQTKDERAQEEKPAKVYCGNGRVVWTPDNVIKKADFIEKGTSSSEQSTAGRETPDLPF